MIFFLLSLSYLTTVTCWVLAGTFLSRSWMDGNDEGCSFFIVTSIPILNIIMLFLICLTIANNKKE